MRTLSKSFFVLARHKPNISTNITQAPNEYNLSVNKSSIKLMKNTHIAQSPFGSLAIGKDIRNEIHEPREEHPEYRCDENHGRDLASDIVT